MRLPWLALLALGIQILAVQFLATLAPALVLGLAVSHLLLGVVVLANRRLWGARLVAIGLALNVTAMVVNGGLMPVTPETLGRAGISHLAANVALGGVIPGTKDILLERSSVKMYPITDVIITSFPGSRAYSVGDGIIVAGAVLFMVEVAVRTTSRYRAQPGQRCTRTLSSSPR